MIERNHQFLSNPEDQKTIKHVLNMLSQSQVKLPAAAPSPAPPGSSTSLEQLALLDVMEVAPAQQNAFNAEVQQEQEQEQVSRKEETGREKEERD